MSDQSKLERWQAAFSLAAQAMTQHGVEIACPWEGDLDDAKKERFDGLVAAVDAYLTVFPAGAKEAVSRAILFEREACAKVAEGTMGVPARANIAASIRARTQP